MVLTPQMAISHLVMIIGVGISQKKNIKKFDLVTILWFDPYIVDFNISIDHNTIDPIIFKLTEIIEKEDCHCTVLSAPSGAGVVGGGRPCPAQSCYSSARPSLCQTSAGATSAASQPGLHEPNTR